MAPPAAKRRVRGLAPILALLAGLVAGAAAGPEKALIVPVDVTDDARYGPDARRIATVDPETGDRVVAENVWWPREHIVSMMKQFRKIGAGWVGKGKIVPGKAWLPRGVCIRRGRRIFAKTPCLISPSLREHYLDMVREILAYGVDGLNLGYKNHGNLTSEPESEFGFNPAVVDLYRARFGEDIAGDFRRRDIGKYQALREEALGELVRAISAETRRAGKQVFVYVNDPDAWQKAWHNVYYRATMGYMRRFHWAWQTWAAKGWLDAMMIDCDPMAPYHKARWTAAKEAHVSLLKSKYPGVRIFMEYRMYGPTKDADRGWAREYIRDAWRSKVLDGLSCYEGFFVGYPPFLTPGSRREAVTEAIVQGMAGL